MSTATIAAPTTRRAPLTATIDQPDLLAALRFVSASIDGGRTKLPILAGVLLTAERGKVTLSGFDYERSAQQTILAPGAKGTVLVKARTLLDMVGVLPKDAAVILTSNGETLTVEGGGVVFTLPTLPLDEFPLLPSRDGGVELATVTGEQFATLRWVLAAAGRDDTLPVLTGVHLTVNADTGNLTAATTDRYRLAVYDSPFTVNREAFTDADKPSMLVPARVLHDVIRMFGKEKQVTLTVTRPSVEQVLWISDGNRTMSTRLLDGEFPKYRSLLPDVTNVVASLAVPVKAMLTAVKRAAIGASRTSPVRMILAGTGKVTIQTGYPRLDSCTAIVPIPEAEQTGQIDTPDQAVAYNPAYLHDGFRVFDADDTVTMHVLSPVKPALFTSDARPGFVYLLMPVRLAG
jgi:DNA polymerase-3 subunit beta